MTQPTSRLLVGILFVTLLTVTAGCMAVLGGDPDPERIADELAERNDKIEDVQGTQVVTIDTGESTQRTVAEVVERPPEASRQEVIETDSEWQSVGDVMVSNGEKMVVYDAAENTATEFELNYEPESAAFANEQLIERALNESEVSYEGSDTVADRDVHVIELTDERTSRSTTVWVDTEFWYPLKYETTMDQGDQQFTTTMTYTEVTFNAGVDDTAFEFEPPADATVEQYDPPETQTVDSMADVEAATPYDVTEPELPERFSFAEGTITEHDGSTTAFVSYTAEDERVGFTTTNNTAHEPTGESVEIGDTEGTISEYGDQQSVTWDCEGIRYRLSGELDRETLLDSATSVGC